MRLHLEALRELLLHLGIYSYLLPCLKFPNLQLACYRYFCFLHPVARQYSLGFGILWYLDIHSLPILLAMRSSTWSVALLGSAAQVLAAPTARDAPTYTGVPERAAAVQEAFDRAWNGYYTYAFPHDSLAPLSESYADGL